MLQDIFVTILITSLLFLLYYVAKNIYVIIRFMDISDAVITVFNVMEQVSEQGKIPLKDIDKAYIEIGNKNLNFESGLELFNYLKKSTDKALDYYDNLSKIIISTNYFSADYDALIEIKQKLSDEITNFNETGEIQN